MISNGAFSDFVDNVLIRYINYAIYLITAATVLYTVIGAFHMIGSEEKREEGKTAVYYGIIALFVMTAIWGLVNILDSTFGLSGGNPITPQPIQRSIN
jgi:Type IV secretion system pilin